MRGDKNCYQLYTRGPCEAGHVVGEYQRLRGGEILLLAQLQYISVQPCSRMRPQSPHASPTHASISKNPGASPFWHPSVTAPVTS